MRIQALSVWILLEFLATCYAVSYNDFAFPIEHSLVHNYSRITEIKKHCNSFISSASELESDENRATRLKKELSFYNGDWEQDSLGAPLMPFDDSDMPHATSSFIYPWKVVSFEVQNVNSGAPYLPKNTVAISGVMSIGITRNSTIISEPGLKFHKRPGMSALRVEFEGLYLETEENEGERIICLLGDSLFPFKKVPTRFSEEYMTLYFSDRDTIYNEEPVILPHDQILLILRYPKPLSLYASQILGEMTSLNKIEEFEYFDKVHITSHSGILPEYHTSSFEETLLKSIEKNPLQDAILEDGVNKFTNSEFCRILKHFEHEEYRVMPNLKLGGQNWFQDTVGPFLLRNDIVLVDRNNEILRVVMHKISCKEDKVSGVLRMYPASMTPNVAARRTSLSTLTLSVKGRWNSSTGLLSMVGCLGPMLVNCDSGIILYFTKSLSSKQRSVVSGSIFSLKDTFFPVFIGLEMLSPGLHDGGWYYNAYLSYNYSKIDLARKFRERIQEPQLSTYIRKFLFWYPSLEEEKEGNLKLTRRLSDDLTINTFSSFETLVRVEVLSLGPLFRTNGSLFYQDSNHEVLNISLNLLLIEKKKKIYEESYRHVSKLYLEGLYERRVGKLYLIGCRKVDFDHVYLERGLDCLIEVTIKYSPLNTIWLINPSAKITIASQRNKEDSYYFEPIDLLTFMIRDKNHEKDVIIRKIFDGYFRVLLLLVIVTHLVNQIKKMKKSSETVIYISLLMPGLWIFGYGIALISNREILIKSLESLDYKNQIYDLQNHRRHLNNLDYFARFLVLVSMFLMARIFQMVLKARKVLLEQGESTPSEKKVILGCLGVYVCYLIVGGFNLYLGEVTLSKDFYMKLVMVYDIQDFFLLPQIIALRIWKPRLSNPLPKNFLVGLCIPVLVQFVYEVVRGPLAHILFQSLVNFS